jgi:hypothetical protein
VSREDPTVVGEEATPDKPLVVTTKVGEGEGMEKGLITSY